MLFLSEPLCSKYPSTQSDVSELTHTYVTELMSPFRKSDQVALLPKPNHTVTVTVKTKVVYAPHTFDRVVLLLVHRLMRQCRLTGYNNRLQLLHLKEAKVISQSEGNCSIRG